MSHVHYAPLALSRLEKDGTDGRTDGRQTVTLRFPLDAANIINGTEKCVTTTTMTIIAANTELHHHHQLLLPYSDLIRLMMGSILLQHSLAAGTVVCNSDASQLHWLTPV